MQVHQVSAGFFRGAHIGFADHLHQRHAGAVDIHQAVTAAVAGEVLHLGNVFFEMDPADSDGFGTSVAFDIQVAVNGDGQIVLGNLVALHQVGVRVVLPVELGEPGNAAVEGKAGHNGVLDGALVDDRQRSRQPQAHGTDAAVHRGALVVGATGAEHLALRLQLYVDFQSDYGFVFHTFPVKGYWRSARARVYFFGDVNKTIAENQAIGPSGRIIRPQSLVMTRFDSLFEWAEHIATWQWQYYAGPIQGEKISPVIAVNSPNFMLMVSPLIVTCLRH